MWTILEHIVFLFLWRHILLIDSEISDIPILKYMQVMYFVFYCSAVKEEFWDFWI